MCTVVKTYRIKMKTIYAFVRWYVTAAPHLISLLLLLLSVASRRSSNNLRFLIVTSTYNGFSTCYTERRKNMEKERRKLLFLS